VRAYRLAVAAFAIAFVAIGIAITALTLARGGGLGLLLGPLFVALGVGRLYLLRGGGGASAGGRDTSGSDGR
jgi:hypothetical protein